MIHGWDSTCSGGIWWSKARRYKNAIANELFLQVAAGLHIRTPGDTAFAAWAAREWAWFLGTGMLTASHLVIDGLADCNPVLSSPAWTDNQGALIGGLVSLAQITGQGSFLVTAEQTANALAGSSALSPGGILRDPCEPSSCGLDEPLFTARQTSALDVLNTQLTGACLPRRAARTPGHPGRPRSCCWPPGPSGGPGQRAWRPDADGPGPPPRAGRRLPRPGSARRQLGQPAITADIAAGRVPAHRKPAPALQRTLTLASRPCRRGSLGG